MFDFMFLKIPKFKKGVPLKPFYYNVKKKLNKVNLYNDYQFRNHWFSIIKMNSTYMDVINWHYEWKGIYNFFTMFVFFVVFIVIFLSMFESFFVEIFIRSLLFYLIFFVILSPLFFFVFFLGYKWDNKIFTHYPIRFNRHTRKVYFLDVEGNYQEGNYDEMEFFITCVNPVMGFHQIWGAVLDEEGKVQHCTSLGPMMGNSEFLEYFWNFVSLYMTQGPKPLYPYYYKGMEQNNTVMASRLTFCNDIDEKRESAEFSAYRVKLNSFYLKTLYLVRKITLNNFLWVIGRRYAMKNCTVPLWPEWIKEQNKISEDDPYIVDASINEYYCYDPAHLKIHLIKQLPDHYLVEKPDGIKDYYERYYIEYIFYGVLVGTPLLIILYVFLFD